ncbi:hypothetical protein I4U23_004845 [Adineta vaga]|nr:hypothetical protein I4U23_004845 [Adineta vaga]
MTKKFRCGRLMLTKAGQIKKVDLGNGGGTRTCDESDDHMTFDDVHNQLLMVFSLENKKHQTSLYDFQLQPLDRKQFKTLNDYRNKYGLNRNSTVLYICTSDIDNDAPRELVTENPNSSITIVKNEPDPIPEEIQITQSESSSEYSFIDHSNDIMKNMRELINQSPSNKILIELFDKICLIHGYVFSIVVPLENQRHNEQLNESEVSLYLSKLKKIYTIFLKTQSLLYRNIAKFSHMPLFSTIQSAFSQFYTNIKLVRSRWMKYMEKKESNSELNILSSSLTVSDIKSTLNDDQKKNLIDSSSEQLTGKELKEKMKAFRRLLDRLRSLSSYVSKRKHLSSFREFILSSMEKIKSLRSDVDLLDELSICNGKKVLLTIKNEFSKKIEEAQINQSTSMLDQLIHNACKNTLRDIRFLLTTLYSYQMKIYHEKQENITNY